MNSAARAKSPSTAPYPTRISSATNKAGINTLDARSTAFIDAVRHHQHGSRKPQCVKPQLVDGTVGTVGERVTRGHTIEPVKRIGHSQCKIVDRPCSDDCVIGETDERDRDAEPAN